MTSDQGIQLSDNELEIILNDLIDQYGYDFTQYSKPSIKRRIIRLISTDGFHEFSEFRSRLKKDTRYLERFVEQVTVNVTEMFRDPSFYKSLRDSVLPILATWPTIRIWHAGCSTGEEVYSMAILLHEANLLDKSLLYATDINPKALEKVREGIFPLSRMKEYSENYIIAGGKENFSSYYSVQNDSAKFNERFGEKIVLAVHNLVSDASFNEFQLILCRNVMIYFDKHLQDKTIHLFYKSLEMQGFLALGTKETLKFTDIGKKFQHLDGKEKIWQKLS